MTSGGDTGCHPGRGVDGAYRGYGQRREGLGFPRKGRVATRSDAEVCLHLADASLKRVWFPNMSNGNPFHREE